MTPASNTSRNPWSAQTAIEDLMNPESSQKVHEDQLSSLAKYCAAERGVEFFGDDNKLNDVQEVLAKLFKSDGENLRSEQKDILDLVSPSLIEAFLGYVSKIINTGRKDSKLEELSNQLGLNRVVSKIIDSDRLAPKTKVAMLHSLDLHKLSDAKASSDFYQFLFKLDPNDLDKATFSKVQDLTIGNLPQMGNPELIIPQLVPFLSKRIQTAMFYNAKYFSEVYKVFTEIETKKLSSKTNKLIQDYLKSSAYDLLNHLASQDAHRFDVQKTFLAYFYAKALRKFSPEADLKILADRIIDLSFSKKSSLDKFEIVFLQELSRDNIELKNCILNSLSTKIGISPNNRTSHKPDELKYIFSLISSSGLIQNQDFENKIIHDLKQKSNLSKIGLLQTVVNADNRRACAKDVLTKYLDQESKIFLLNFIPMLMDKKQAAELIIDLLKSGQSFYFRVTALEQLLDCGQDGFETFIAKFEELKKYFYQDPNTIVKLDSTLYKFFESMDLRYEYAREQTHSSSWSAKPVEINEANINSLAKLLDRLDNTALPYEAAQFLELMRSIQRDNS
jgi:hypothetical protein